jgi:hypothetical protein
MEKAAAYAISAFIVGFGLWILIAGLCPLYGFALLSSP